MLNLGQVELLWSENGARSGNSDPADEGLSIDLIVFHGVEADQSAGTTETSLAMNSDCTGLWVGEVLLTRVHKLVNDGLGRGGSVGEDH